MIPQKNTFGALPSVGLFAIFKYGHNPIDFN